MMTSTFRAACCALALATTLSAPAQAANEVVISCFRGPWTDIIWDRPNGKFIDSLMGLGYDISTATDIATRVCRDADVLGKPDEMKALTLRLISETPRSRRAK